MKDMLVMMSDRFSGVRPAEEISVDLRYVWLQRSWYYGNECMMKL